MTSHIERLAAEDACAVEISRQARLRTLNRRSAGGGFGRLTLSSRTLRNRLCCSSCSMSRLRQRSWRTRCRDHCSEMVLAEESIAERHGCMIELASTFSFSGRFYENPLRSGFPMRSSSETARSGDPDATGQGERISLEAALLAGRLVLSVSAKVVRAWDIDPCIPMVGADAASGSTGWKSLPQQGVSSTFVPIFFDYVVVSCLFQLYELGSSSTTACATTLVASAARAAGAVRAGGGRIIDVLESPEHAPRNICCAGMSSRSKSLMP